jgi:hypothetical protein
MTQQDDKRQHAEGTPAESVEVWGRDVTREEFLEGRYGAATESEADDARAGGSLVTPTQVEEERLSGAGNASADSGGGVDSRRPDAASSGYDAESDALSHGISRTETHIAGTDVGRTPTDPSGAYETGDEIPPR